jgi:hypothetical protein
MDVIKKFENPFDYCSEDEEFMLLANVVLGSENVGGVFDADFGSNILCLLLKTISIDSLYSKDFPTSE